MDRYALLSPTDFPLGRVSMSQQNSRICIVSRLAIIGTVLVFTLSPDFALSQSEISPRFTGTVQAIRRAEPAVVNIEGNKPASSVTGARSDTQQVNGMGAGVIIDSRGYILTNQHVVQDVGRIEVTLSSGRQYIGRLIARDSETDLALIKIDARTALPVITCGTSSDLMRGEPVIAIGNPYGYHHTVTEGIISALHRDIPVNGVQDYPDLIQTDASINPGNSGGPLLNAEGIMIGINAAVRMGAQGIGFAIPVDRATEVAADMIIQHRRGAFQSPLKVETVYDKGKSAVRVIRSSYDSVDQGDVIATVNGRPVSNRLHYELALIGKRSGSRIEIEVDRDGEALVASLKLDSRGTPRTQLVSTANSSIRDQVYREMGIQLEPANATLVNEIDSSYKGGLKITSVRSASPADKAQIQEGDILVGLLEWQTPNWEDLNWIMKSKEMRSADSPKFHIMRNQEVFWGTLELQ